MVPKYIFLAINAPFLLMLAWFDVTVTKPPLQQGLKLGKCVVYFKPSNPSPGMVLPVYLSQDHQRGCLSSRTTRLSSPASRPCPFSVVGVWCSTGLRFLKGIVMYVYDCGFHFHPAWQPLTRDPQLCKEKRVHTGSLHWRQQRFGVAFP